MAGQEPLSPQARVLIIGIGNEYRSDDAVGLIIARRLKDGAGARLAVLEQSGEGTALMETWQQAESVIVVDAVYAGAEPGTVYRFDAQDERLPAKFFNYSTHAFSVAEAVELARALHQLPSRLVVYGVEGKNFSSGVGLSPEVERAAQVVVERIVNEIRYSI
jgi:hydrogenase maturation protease